MITMHDEYINHGMNGVKVWHHGMTWHGDGTKCGKKWHFRGQKWAKKGVARGMAKLHRKIRLLECARGGVFGVARGGAEIAVFGDFWGWRELAWFGLPQEVARENWILSKQTLLRSNETSCQETNNKQDKHKNKIESCKLKE